MLQQDEKRGVEEAYTSASNSSNMRMRDADLSCRSDVDVIAAAGMVRSRVGMALLRLHSEWDRVEKPRKPTDMQVKMIAQSMRRIAPAYVFSQARMQQHLKAEPTLRLKAARLQAQSWYAAELNRMFGRLRGLPEMRIMLIAEVESWGMTDAAPVVAAVLAHWFDPTCEACHGVGVIDLPGAAVPATRSCKVCRGQRFMPVPCGDSGRRVAAYIDDCLSCARGSLKKRLRGAKPAA